MSVVIYLKRNQLGSRITVVIVSVLQTLGKMEEGRCASSLDELPPLH